MSPKRKAAEPTAAAPTPTDADPASGRVPATFEAAFAELQQVVEQLEQGGLELERAVALFDRGGALAQRCEGLVDAAELRVTRLAAESASLLSDGPTDTVDPR